MGRIGGTGVGNHSGFWAAGITTIALLLGVVGTASADNQVITISPTTYDASIAAGTAKHSSFEVIDQGKTAYNFSVYATSYSVKGSDYTPDFSPLKSAPNVPNWFTFTNTQGQANPDQVVTIGYTINVPAGTQPGDYYAAIFAQTKAAQNSGSSVVLNQRVGELVYLRVPGKEVLQGSVDTWSVPWLQHQPLSATVKLKNSGSTYYKATIQVVMSDILNHPKYVLTSDKYVLRQTIRSLPVQWQKTPSFGLFKVSGSVTYLGKTQNLATHYVIVANTPLRIIFSLLIVVLLSLSAYSVGRMIGERRKRNSKS